VSILVIGLAQKGLLGPFQAMTALYGANIGSTFARMVLSSALTGSVRQLTAFQDLFKATGSTLFMVMLYLEASLGVPLVYAFVSHLSSKTDRQMAFVYLLLNTTMAILFSVFQGSILRLLERWLPGDDTENLSRPQFLYYEALEEPSTALDLIEREQLRLIKALITYTQAMRAGAQTAEHQSAARIHQQFGSIANHIDQFQHELTSKQLGAEELERLTQLQGRLSLIVYIEDNLRALNSSAEAVPKKGPLADLFSTFTESLDFLLLTVIDALEGKDLGIVEMLSGMTSERGELMERIRSDFLAEETAAPAERAVLFEVTSLFERIVWMTNRLSRLMNTGFSKAKPLAAS
jgi:phosphate:Na+ symporter